MVFSRNSRSWRKRPSFTAACRSALVAEKTRTSTRRVLDEPTRSNSPVSIVRSSLACRLRDVGDFVQKQRAAVGHFEAADAIALGVGKGALDVAEQFALENALGQAAGVDRNQRPGRAQRDRMQRLRHQAFAGAVFAGDQDIGVRRPDPRDHVQHRPHGRRIGDQLRETLRAQRPVLRFQPLPFAQRAAQLDLGLEDGGEPRVVPGLLNEIARARAASLPPPAPPSPRPSSRSPAAWCRASGCGSAVPAPPVRRWYRACSSGPSGRHRNRAIRRHRSLPAAK